MQHARHGYALRRCIMAHEAAWLGAGPGAGRATLGKPPHHGAAPVAPSVTPHGAHVPPAAVDFEASHGSQQRSSTVEKPYSGDWVQPGVGGTAGNPATVVHAQPPPLEIAPRVQHFDVPPRRGSVSPRGSPPGAGFGASSGSMVDRITPRYMQTLQVAATVGKFAALSANYQVPVSVRRKQAAELRACLMRIDRILDEPESHVQP